MIRRDLAFGARLQLDTFESRPTPSTPDDLIIPLGTDVGDGDFALLSDGRAGESAVSGPGRAATQASVQPTVLISFPTGQNSYLVSFSIETADGGTHTMSAITVDAYAGSDARDFVLSALLDIITDAVAASATGIMFKSVNSSPIKAVTMSVPEISPTLRRPRSAARAA